LGVSTARELWGVGDEPSMDKPATQRRCLLRHIIYVLLPFSWIKKHLGDTKKVLILNLNFFFYTLLLPGAFSGKMIIIENYYDRDFKRNENGCTILFSTWNMNFLQSRALYQFPILLSAVRLAGANCFHFRFISSPLTLFIVLLLEANDGLIRTSATFYFFSLSVE
jgi:hypothetical protein